MLQIVIRDYIKFLNTIPELAEPTKAEDLAKTYNLELPPALARTTIGPDDGVIGKYKLRISTLKSPLLNWLIPYVAKTKCFLICIDLGDRTHCIHLCITCLDSWPGPGCYIHGSYD